MAQVSAADFSSHLFWDVDLASIDLEKNRKWLVKRVLEKGELPDWKLLKQTYDREELREAVMTMRSLERRALSFACAVLEIDQTKTRCFMNLSSQATHWSY